MLMEGVIIALVPIGVVQTGALIYFCGVVITTLRDHSKRIDRIEERCDEREKCGRYAGEGILS